MGRETETQSLTQSRHGGEAIHRPMKKALDLRGVKVHRDDVFDADGFKQIRHDSRADRFSMPVPFVASGVPEVRYDGKNGGGRRAATGIGQEQQLHEVIIHRRRGKRLHQDHVALTD
jgi:hypothetical protein